MGEQGELRSLNKEIKTNLFKSIIWPRAERVCQVGKLWGAGGDCGKPRQVKPPA